MTLTAAEQVADNLFALHGRPATYTTVTGTETNVLLIHRAFVGALDNRENATSQVRVSQVANPAEGDSYVFDNAPGERWDVTDVRERLSRYWWDLRVARTKEIG